MSAIEIKVYELFKAKFGEAEATSVIEYFDQKAEEKINQKKDIFLTKDDKIDIMEKMGKMDAQLMVIKWMLGVVLAGVVSLILKTFFS